MLPYASTPYAEERLRPVTSRGTRFGYNHHHNVHVPAHRADPNYVPAGDRVDRGWAWSARGAGTGNVPLADQNNDPATQMMLDEREQRLTDRNIQRYKHMWTVGKFLIKHKKAFAEFLIPGTHAAIEAWNQAGAGNTQELTHVEAGRDYNPARSQYLSGSSSSRSFSAATSASRLISQALDSQPMSGRKRAQTREANAARKIQKLVSGGSGRLARSRVGLVRSMFQPGRGAEVPYIHDNLSQPISMASGLSGPDTLSKRQVLMKQFDGFAGQEVSMSFAYNVKLRVNPLRQDKPNVTSTSIDVSAARPTRFCLCNVFRHCDTNVFAYDTTGPLPTQIPTLFTTSPKGLRQPLWHCTLGPDSAYVRVGPGDAAAVAAGTSGPWWNEPNLNSDGDGYVSVTGNPAPSLLASQTVAIPNQHAPGLAVTLKSPFRTPVNFQEMKTRLCIQQLENISWNLNHLKFKSPANTDATGTLSAVPLKVYDNAVLNEFASGSTCPSNSLAWQQPAQQAYPGSGRFATNGIYKVQFGPGSVSYQFCNNASSPCIVDCVWVRLKKGLNSEAQALGFGGITTTQMIVNQCARGYLNRSYANQGVVQLAGKIPDATDVSINAECEFLPTSGFNFSSPSTTVVTQSTLAGALNAFAVVSRDQFIVPAGAVKPWRTTFPSMNYDARNWDTNKANTDDRTVFLMFGFSGVTTCRLESNMGDVNSTTEGVSGVPTNAFVGQYQVIDRAPTSVDMSVTGNYLERPKPCYLTEFVNKFYIRGVLNEPSFFPRSSAAYAADNLLSVPSSVQYADLTGVGKVARTTGAFSSSTSTSTGTGTDTGAGSTTAAVEHEFAGIPFVPVGASSTQP